MIMAKKSARSGELVAVETALVKQDAMRSAMLAAYDALQEADSIYEAKNIRHKLELFQEMARLAKNVELQNMAAEMRLRAERRVGEFLIEMDRVKPKDRLKKGPVVVVSDHVKPTLSDLKITKDQSANWQKLAKMPEEDFDGMIDEFKKRGTELTTRAMLMEATESLRGSGRTRGTRETRGTKEATEAEPPPFDIPPIISYLGRDEQGRREISFDRGYAATFKGQGHSEGRKIWTKDGQFKNRPRHIPHPSAETGEAARWEPYVWTRIDSGLRQLGHTHPDFRHVDLDKVWKWLRADRETRLLVQNISRGIRDLTKRMAHAAVATGRTRTADRGKRPKARRAKKAAPSAARRKVSAPR